MSSFVEPRLLPAVRSDHWTRPEEQVSHRLADARLERRELARERAVNRTGERRD